MWLYLASWRFSGFCKDKALHLAVTGVLAELGDIGTLADSGCGDFNIGSVISPHVGRYDGCDVAETSINANKARSKVDHVEFRALVRNTIH